MNIIIIIIRVKKKEEIMSAFLVEDKIINKIVTKLALDRDGSWAQRMLGELGYDLETLKGRKKLGWDMFGLNIRAVNMRYPNGQAEDFRTLDFKVCIDGNYSKVNVLKSLQCWMYQCSEGDCEKSPLFNVMQKIAYNWACEIVRTMPEYEKAAWG